MDNNEFLDWICKKTKDGKTLYIDSFPYDLSNSSDSDKFSMLPSFYDKVDNYMKNNYIEPYKNEIGEFYQIQYNDVALDIGRRYSTREVYYCEVSKEKYEPIDCDYILNNINYKNTDIKLRYLERLRNDIISLKNVGLSEETINKETNKVLIDCKIKRIYK